MNLLSRVRPSVTPWTSVFHAPPSMGFSRQEYWSEVGYEWLSILYIVMPMCQSPAPDLSLSPHVSPLVTGSLFSKSVQGSLCELVPKETLCLSSLSPPQAPSPTPVPWSPYKPSANSSLLMSTKMTNMLVGKVTLDQASCPPICLLI